ncbi:hypothetical protein FKR81_09745 [Lentzea tibetensis]|uniref:Uncharacterized protein n=1 Tax=Lentzea tibetensis TaxID=2591470 RepID=A0A563EY20_9PSEU|nr:hypothetical protein [Lentzea tibetensis]TWP52586.1 hypothetical protein FKR81_09745 [Lentzea tibetensis]
MAKNRRGAEPEDVLTELNICLRGMSQARQTLVLLPFVAVLGLLYFLFWPYIAPWTAAVVDPVPVLSTVAGWILPGGVVAATGLYFLNRGALTRQVRRRVEIILCVWGVLALLCYPRGFGAFSADEHRAYWTGLAAGTVAFTLLVLGKLISDKVLDRTKGWFLLAESVAFLFLAAVIR